MEGNSTVHWNNLEHTLGGNKGQREYRVSENPPRSTNSISPDQEKRVDVDMQKMTASLILERISHKGDVWIVTDRLTLEHILRPREMCGK